MAMSWCFSDEATAASLRVQDRLEQEAALVPSHWFLEVTNVLAMAEKRKRIAQAQIAAFLELLQVLDIRADDSPSFGACARLLSLCRGHGLTSYDAAYLDLALRSRLPLATLDKGLKHAAKSIGIEILTS